MPRPLARCATRKPMRPSPMTPSVLSCTSTPPQRDFSQRPAFKALWACGMLRAQASSMAIVCSAAESTLLWGAFTTTMPRLVAASTSMLSTPTPARPITLRRVPASMTSAVTLAAERTTRPSNSPMRRTNSSWSQSIPSTTSNSCSRRSMPALPSLSLTRTFLRASLTAPPRSSRRPARRRPARLRRARRSRAAPGPSRRSRARRRCPTRRSSRSGRGGRSGP